MTLVPLVFVWQFGYICSLFTCTKRVQ